MYVRSVYQGSGRMPASSPPMTLSGGPAFTPSGSTSTSASSTNGSTNGSTLPPNSMGMANGNIIASGIPPMMMSNMNINSNMHHTNHHAGLDQLSKTNLYIRGLNPNTTDRDLQQMCQRYGNILSTKAILDKTTNKCRGYGFVDFEQPHSAEAAVQDLLKQGIQAQMAKCTDTNKLKHPSASTPNKMQQEQDPTNLYIANLPPFMNESELEALLTAYGTVVSTRILRDQNGQPRGVGFARMETKERCDQIISLFNGKLIPGCKEPLLVKFADGGNKKKNSQFKTQSDRSMREQDQMQISPYGPLAAQMMGANAMAAFSPHRPYPTGPGGPTGVSNAALGSGYSMPTPQWMPHPSAPYLSLPGHPSMGTMMPQMSPAPNPSMHYNAALAAQMSPLAAQISRMSLSTPSYVTAGGSPYAAGSSTPGMYQPGAAGGGMPVTMNDVNSANQQ